MLVGFWCVQGAALYVMWPAVLAEDLGDWTEILLDAGYLLVAGCAIAIVTAMQLVLVMPVNKPSPAKSRGWPVRFSLAVAGAAMATLVAGTLFIVGDVMWLVTGFNAVDEALEEFDFWAVIAPLVIGWVIVTPLLLAFCRRGPRESLLARVSARIFLGTMVEVAALIPVDVMVRRKTNCYCGHGTFWALLFCGTVGVFALGPAIFLPVLARRRKRWYAGRCEVCGYDMSGCPEAERCPECGSGWRSPRERNEERGTMIDERC